jgi:3-carboxy-cis,cis-muconate cycloisomerase
VTDLLWPGDERAAGLFSGDAVLAAMARVETAWLSAQGFDADLEKLLEPGDAERVARESESDGNPVIPLLALLRERLGDSPAATALHRGLTSQDTLDTGVVLCLREAISRVRADIRAQVGALTRLAADHRETPRAGRTLTQPAVPITFGLTVATWLGGVLDAAAQTDVDLPIQIGGAAGNLAGPHAAGSGLIPRAAEALGLPAAAPWHTRRAPLTRAGDAFVACTDAWGHIANDVLTGSRPEIGELSEARGGGSSAMPQKRNPTLSVLIRRAALAAPALAATLHTAAANQLDERPDGAWHVEWATLRTLARRTVVAGSQTADLLAGLRVDAARMAANLESARPGIDAERERLGGDYRGAEPEIIDAVLRRAAEWAS